MRKIALALIGTLSLVGSTFAQSSSNEETPEQKFKRLDKDQNNKLSTGEIHDHYIDQLLASYDQDNDGSITKSELEDAIAEQEKQGEVTPQMARKVELEFNKLDKNRDNQVSRQELAIHLGSLGNAVLFPGEAPEQTNIDQPIMLQQWQDMHTTGGIPLMSIRF